MKSRLDKKMTDLRLVASRSQAESYIKLGQVKVDNKLVTKPGFLVDEQSDIMLLAKEQFVGRAGLKLASVADIFKLDFQAKTVLDVGSSTGGFTDYSLRHGASKIIAVEVGTNQLHPSLRGDPRIELHEKTDIRGFQTEQKIDIVVADVSFISLREVLPDIARLSNRRTQIVVMVKPQFEAIKLDIKHKGVVKNDRLRRQILKDFENWSHQNFIITAKADSKVSGATGNQERFYCLSKAIAKPDAYVKP